MAASREEEAADYLKKHRIMELVENLSSLLLFYRPENPREFMVEHLQQLKDCQQSRERGPGLFNTSNLDTVFGILDPAQRNYISLQQYKQALTALGVEDFNQHPEGVNEDRISLQTFRTEVMEGLKKSSATYEQL
ncbi:EF-hand calcium-binding domain-containing protein 10 [Sphaeramia orbicularis]|uniref:EF-hand calcium-binding domain-containing protein 10 n=1 Tax=Sphaeramia orbicularis TaxID=375764 RepID=UPI00117CF14D|nr:EF-hand calcium-binding domain-containing protein 10 [Sphaeramia orbicularis]